VAKNILSILRIQYTELVLLSIFHSFFLGESRNGIIRI